MIAPFLVELDEFIELRLEIIRGRSLIDLGLFRGGVEINVSWRLGKIYHFGGSLSIGVRALLEIGIRGGGFLENRVLLQFLFDEGFKFQRGSLKQRKGLLELGSQHQRLR